MKIYHFTTLVIKDEKTYQSNKFSQPTGQYISQLLETNLLPETTVSQTQTTFICSNSTILTVEQSVKHIQS